MADPYEIALANARARTQGARGMASPRVGEVLEKEEQPGTFEQFFRFLGRPGFVVRSLMSGNFESAGRNLVQLFNELGTGIGVFNPEFTLTGIADKLPMISLPRDFTSQEDRPEFTTMLGQMGLVDPQYMGGLERTVLDVVGGIATDPLTLIGGPGKGLALGSLDKLKYSKAALGREVAAAIKTAGGAANQAELASEFNAVLGELRARLVSRGTNTPLFNTLNGLDASNLSTLRDRAVAAGMNPDRATSVVRGAESQAAQRLFFRLAEAEGQGRIQRAARTFSPDPTKGGLEQVSEEMVEFLRADSPKALFSLARDVPEYAVIQKNMDELVKTGALQSKPIQEAGLESTLYYRARQEGLADNLQGLLKRQAEASDLSQQAVLHTEIGRLYGYSDDAIRGFLTRSGLPDVVDSAQTWRRYMDELPTEILNDGIRAMRQRGMAAGEGFTWYLPWRGWQHFSWRDVTKLTLPGLLPPAMKSLKSLQGSTIPALDKVGHFGAFGERALGELGSWARAGLGWARNRIIDRYEVTQGVDAVMSRVARESTSVARRRAMEHADTAERSILTPFPLAEERYKFSQELDLAGEAWRVSQSDMDEALKTMAGNPDQMANALLTRPMREKLATLPDMGGDMTRVQEWARSGLPPAGRVLAGIDATAWDMLRAVRSRVDADYYYGRARDQIVGALGRPQEVDEALRVWTGAMRRVPPYLAFAARQEEALQGLKAEAQTVWRDSLWNPFYVPHQLNPRLSEMLDEALLDETMRLKINDVFQKQRQYKTRGEFLQRLEGLADEFKLQLDEAEPLSNDDFADLFYRRMAAHELTVVRQSIWQEASRLVSAGKGQKVDYRFYINRVLRPMASLDHATGQVKHRGERGFLARVLSGGEFKTPAFKDPAALRQAVERLNEPGNFFEGMKARVHSEGSNHFIKWTFPGLNAVFKPLLTSHPANVKFRVRNVLSSAVMANFDPDLGFEGFKQIWGALRNDGMVRWALRESAKTPAQLKQLVDDGAYAEAVVRYLHGGSVAERDAAYQVLVNSGRSVGPYSWPEAAKHLRLVLGGAPISPADLQSGRDLLPAIWPSAAALTKQTRGNQTLARRALETYNRYIKWGEQLSGEIETRFRATSMLHLLSKGVDPVEAGRRINKAFVDYSRQSSVERFLRDTIPFARFMIGSTQWIPSMLENPRALQMLSAGSRSLKGQLAGEAGGGQFLPTEAAGTIALPLPWRDREGNVQFLTSLGLPHESAIQMIGAASFNLQEFRKNVLGSVHPAVRLPLEGIGGKSFYFGTDFGSYRRAPGYLPEFLTQRIPGRDGKPDRFEIDGAANEIMNALPTAGVQSTIDKLFDSRREWWNKVINSTTGLRTTSADLEREVKRRVAAYLQAKVQSGQIGEVQAFFTRVAPEDVPEDLKIMLGALAEDRADKRKRGGR